MIGGGAAETVDPLNGGTQASPWHVGADLTVNEGTISIRNGGFVQSVRGQAGYDGGTTGNANISGASSRWQMLSHFSAGYFGTGIVIVSGGGLIESTQGDIGIEAGSQGTVTITGANSSWTNSGYVVIGYAGTGRLEILEGGSVSNTDAYIGASNGGFGAVTVSGEDSYWFNSGILRVGRDWYGELTIADGATVEADGGLIIADQAGSDGALAIGAAVGGPAAPGELLADTVAFGAGTGRIVFNHTGEAYSFDAAISGAGGIEHWSGHTSLTADSSAFSGRTYIHGGGYLFVNGILGGNITVDGVLGGTGSVAAANIGATGRLTPGNSIGKLTVLGNLAFADGAVYEVEINDGGDTPGVNNDFTYVGGALTIGDGVSVSILPANRTDDGSTYAPGTVYTILTADGGIAGTFALVKTKMAFLTPELSYDANNVYLELALNGGGGGGGGGGGSSALDIVGTTDRSPGPP
ncbi:MAG TPA: hypothetical protein DCF73_09550, partial [Rhodobiaceae bacterium]|nr:hypothetical protein [Rhodobiaceae bacterium]